MEYTAQLENKLSHKPVAAARGSMDRRGRLAEAIEHLIERRRDVLVSYCELAGSDDLNDAECVHPQLRTLCQLMMDYTALGHFEIYERIIEGNERRNSVLDVATRVYPPLADTTELLVDFNDKYDVLDDPDATVNLADDLSQLGETFAVRIELEDQILAALGRPATATAS